MVEQTWLLLFCLPRVGQWSRMIRLDQIQISKARFTLWSRQHLLIQNQ
jgi:hypothetical protein